MNIDAYVAQARAALGRLDALVATVNDVVENRVEKALKVCLCLLLPVYVCTATSPLLSFPTNSKSNLNHKPKKHIRP